MAVGDRRFADRVALVTGAGSGIGRATVLRLADEGAVVCLADIDEAGARGTAESVSSAGGVADVHGLDVTDEGQWEAVVKEIVGARGRLDVIVHCAAISDAAPLTDTSLEAWRRVFAINVEGAFLATKHGLRAMGSRGGSIVLVSSASGIKAAAGAAAYSASKAAVCMLSQTAAKECRDGGVAVRVNTVCPGGVRTPMWHQMAFFRELVENTGSEAAAFESIERETPGGLAEPADVVGAILFLASDEARMMNGVDLVIDGGYVL